ncbi:MAG: type II secretion system protein [Clostridia bacterium]|nr:type II secretion system protein [Clostridia bacterium]
MRKLLNKKGFTLVELMIVVVILGILVAVAVPIFGAVTKNARIKSCKSNMRVIKGNMETYAMTGNNGDQIEIITGTDMDITDEPSFLALFDGGALPLCPGGTEAEKAAGTYTATIKVATASTTYEVKCTTAKGAAGDENHNG